MTPWHVSERQLAAVIKQWNCRPLKARVGRGRTSKGHCVEDVAYFAGEPCKRPRVNGIKIRMYHPSDVTTSGLILLPLLAKRADLGLTQEMLDAAALKAARIALRMCRHQGAVFMEMAGRQLRRFRCPACREVFEVDSSG